ncbi:MAG: cbb3-type cytochrome c oxidase subunit I, partial [Phycisphaerales bacterium]
FLVVMPLSAAFFNFLVPLMIGARDVAFPRLNALSFWIFLFGGLLLNFGFLINEAPRGGWFGYANLTSIQYTPDLSADFWAMGLQVVGLASLIASINFFVTILNMRCKGMTLLKMPMFIWTTLVTQILLFLSLPVITVALVMITFDRHFGTGFFNPGTGGSVVLWQHLFWVFGHPEVYILILPAMGIVSEILATFSRKPLFGYSVMVYSSCAIGFLGFAVWAHHMFTTGMGPWATIFFTAATMLIAVPTGVKIFNWISTVWGGRIQFTTASLYGLSFVAMFTLGGLSGIMHSSQPIDTQHQDTYFVVAHFHYVMMGSTLIAFIGGIHHWWSKIFGKMYNDNWATIAFFFVFIGFNLTFLPQFVMGVHGMPRRYASYVDEFTIYHQLSTIGSFVMLIGFLLHLCVFIHSLVAGRKAAPNPYGALSMEWTDTASPPITHNFHHEPIATHGPYDFDDVVPPQTRPGEFPLPAPLPVKQVTVVKTK